VTRRADTSRSSGTRAARGPGRPGRRTRRPGRRAGGQFDAPR
jgi:hypothetical protein